MVVLDAVHQIQAEQAPDLACRWNCKAGKCGSCSAEINGKPRLMCMTRLNTLDLDEPVTVEPMRAFPLIKDLVTDVSWNFRVKKGIKKFKPRTPDAADGTWRMQQRDIDRVQEFRKCIECFLCQDVCHVLRDHDKHEEFIGPRFFVYAAALEMHPLDTDDRVARPEGQARHRLLQHHQVLHEGVPGAHHITDNAIIPLKERVVDRFYDPVTRLLRMLTARWLTARVADVRAEAPVDRRRFPRRWPRPSATGCSTSPSRRRASARTCWPPIPANFDAVRMLILALTDTLSEPRRQQRQPRAGAGRPAAVGIRARLLRAAWWPSAAPARC